MAAVVAAAAVAAGAALMSQMFAQKAAKKQQKIQTLKDSQDRAFQMQSQAAQNQATGTNQTLAQLMQGYQNILR